MKKDDKQKKDVVMPEDLKSLIDASNEGSVLPKNTSLFPDDEDELEKIEFEFTGDMADPELSYQLYYQGLYKLLRFHLSGLSKSQRELIYDLKNIYLTRGKVKNENGKRGGDSRQAFPSDLQEMFIIITDWIASGANPINLWTTLRDLNIEKGYIDGNYQLK